MSPLTSLIVLLFLLLIALATVAWLTLTARERGERARAERARREDEAPPERPRARPRPSVSNDAVRGAKAPRTRARIDGDALAPPGEPGVQVRPRRPAGEDPFERFLDPERRRRDGGDG